MPDSLYDNLGEIVDRFMVRADISKKKHFARYMILAEECWQDIFQNTLWVIKSVWLPTKAGDPYNYVSTPKDCQRLLSVGNTDNCGLIQPLFYNPQINVIAKPKTKQCGCTCDCGGLCSAVNSLTASTKLMFSIGSDNYYQKIWQQFCPNGDILEFTDTPTKKYNTLQGNSGDFDNSYNSDTGDEPGPVCGGFDIVYVTAQRKICKLDVEKCGCPAETAANNTLFMDCCGFLVNYNCEKKSKICHQFSENINDNFFGATKISECNTKIYYIPSKQWRKKLTKETPDWLLVNYQSTGVSCGEETLVPQYARNLMYAMLDCGRKEYNSSYNLSEKQEANYKKIDEKNKIMAYLSPVSIDFMANIQDAPIRF